MGFGMVASVLTVKRLLHARRVGRTIALGFVVVSAAIGLMAIQPLTIAYVLQALALFIFGLGILATKTVWSNGFFQTLIEDYVGTNAAMHGATLQIGGAVGAVLGTQMQVRFGRGAMEDQVFTQLMQPEQITQLFRQLTLIIIQLIPLDLDPFGKLLLDGYRASFATGYTWTCLVLAGIALVAALVIAIGVRQSLRYRNRVTHSAMLD
jgi:hypothetical protein